MRKDWMFKEGERKLICKEITEKTKKNNLPTFKKISQEHEMFVINVHLKQNFIYNLFLLANICKYLKFLNGRLCRTGHTGIHKKLNWISET